MADLPSYELVQRFMHEAGFPIADPDDEMIFPEAKFMKLASRLVQHGADQELEACCLLLDNGEHAASYGCHDSTSLRAARRPKPPSLKEQALAVLDDCADRLDGAHENTIRRALEALPND
jgi:hypothetical protein